MIAPDGAGGVFAVWEDARSVPTTGYDNIYAQHVTSNGDVAPGWPIGGLPVCTNRAGQIGPVVVSDGAGGFFASWLDSRNNATSQMDIYAQHVRGDGTLAPGWPVDGVAATHEPANDQQGELASDGSGGVYLAWWNSSYVVWVQHLGADGLAAPGWPSDGVLACSLPSLPKSLLADGTGGAVVVWSDWRRGGQLPGGYDVYGLRFLASGGLAPGWPQNGLLLAPGEWRPLLVPDPAGGFFMTSATPTLTGFDGNYALHRFTMDGASASGWLSPGVVVCSAPGDRWGIFAVPDGSGGVLMDWYDYRVPASDVYGSRVQPDGTLASGWPPNGLRVSNPGDPNEFDFGLAPDGLGGAYMSWEGSVPFYNPSYIQHITAAALIAPGWPLYGWRLASTCAQFTPQVVPDGTGGAIAVWEETGGGCARNGLFAQHYAGGGATPVAISIVSAGARDGRVELDWFAAAGTGFRATAYRRTERTDWLALAGVTADGTGHLRYEDRTVSPGQRYAYRLGFLQGGVEQFTAETWVEVPALKLALEGLRPNPAMGEVVAAFTLPSPEPARLELLDVTGREWVAREVGDLGAGSHQVHLGSSVPAGMYWLRLTQGGHSLLARGAVVR